ncbi:MAG: hypothetical protein SGI97_11335 [candidate division Zixibacteria bacterium]|nr:hypothetical protein [candidate division Zixibacteria bacterium]
MKSPEAPKRPIVSGIIWLGVGLVLLSVVNDVLPPLSTSWPMIIIVIGLALILSAVLKDRRPQETR